MHRNRQEEEVPSLLCLLALFLQDMGKQVERGSVGGRPAWKKRAGKVKWV